MAEKRFCPYCGEKLSGQEIFCGKCGKRLEFLSKITPEHNSSVRRRHRLIGKFISVLLVLAVCGSIALLVYTHTDQKQILGTWLQIDENEERTGNGMVFEDDGTVYDSRSGLYGEYEIEDGQLVVNYDDGWGIQTFRFQYELSRNRLTLTLTDSSNQVTLIRAD